MKQNLYVLSFFLCLIFTSVDYLYAFHFSSKTELVSHTYQSLKTSHVPFAVFHSFEANDMLQDDSLHSYIETNIDFITDAASFFIHELYYQTPLLFNEFRIVFGRQHVAYGFHPYMSDAILVHWKGRDFIWASTYFGNAYFENEFNIVNLPWHPMAGVIVHIIPARTWKISPAFRYLFFLDRPHEYVSFHVLKEWTFRMPSPQQRKYKWYKSKQAQATLITEGQIEYEFYSGRITQALGQILYVTPSRFHARVGSKYTQRPLQVKRSDETKSIFEIFGLDEITEIFANVSYRVISPIDLSVMYAYHQYPNQAKKTQHGHLVEASATISLPFQIKVGFRGRYYRSFGGHLYGLGADIQKPFFNNKMTLYAAIDIDQFEKVNGISDFSTAFRGKVTWQFLDHFKADAVWDFEINHVYAFDSKAMVYLTYEYF